MQNALYSTTAPVNNLAQGNSQRQVTHYPPESMTFESHAARDRYIREQRAYGFNVFLYCTGRDEASGVERYDITRRDL
jgi:hypothetical protein